MISCLHPPADGSTSIPRAAIPSPFPFRRGLVFSFYLFVVATSGLVGSQHSGAVDPPTGGSAQQSEAAPSSLSPLGAALAEDAKKRAAGELPKKTVVDEYLENYIGNDDIARASFLAPPGANSLSKTNNLWVDRKRHRVYVDGYVAMREAGLEMFACPVGTKEHESVVATLAKAKEVHAALLAIGAKPGKPASFESEFVPPSGQTIRVWVCWRDEAGKFKVVDARKWVLKVGAETEMKAEWVFSGSGFWKDPADGREYYRADGGDMICVSNFTTAMIDVNTPSSADAGQLQYFPFTDRIPPRGTPIRLVLVPLPEKKQPTDAQQASSNERHKPPKEMVLPINPLGKKLRAKKAAADKAAMED